MSYHQRTRSKCKKCFHTPELSFRNETTQKWAHTKSGRTGEEWRRKKSYYDLKNEKKAAKNQLRSYNYSSISRVGVRRMKTQFIIEREK
jgi:hypothetical protein